MAPWIRLESYQGQHRLTTHLGIQGASRNTGERCRWAKSPQASTL